MDYAVREDKKELIGSEKLKELSKIFFKKEGCLKSFPKKYREFVADKYAKLNLKHKEKYLVTRYQTIVLDRVAVRIIREILNGIDSEADLIDKFKDLVEEKEVRSFVTQLIKVGAINLK